MKNKVFHRSRVHFSFSQKKNQKMKVSPAPSLIEKNNNKEKKRKKKRHPSSSVHGRDDYICNPKLNQT